MIRSFLCFMQRSRRLALAMFAGLDGLGSGGCRREAFAICRDCDAGLGRRLTLVRFSFTAVWWPAACGSASRNLGVAVCRGCLFSPLLRAGDYLPTDQRSDKQHLDLRSSIPLRSRLLLSAPHPYCILSPHPPSHPSLSRGSELPARAGACAGRGRGARGIADRGQVLAECRRGHGLAPLGGEDVDVFRRRSGGSIRSRTKSLNYCLYSARGRVPIGADRDPLTMPHQFRQFGTGVPVGC